MTEQANLVAHTALITVGANIGESTSAGGFRDSGDLDTTIAVLSARANNGSIYIDETNDILLTAMLASPDEAVVAPNGQVFVNAQAGKITIADDTFLQSKTGRVSNAPPKIIDFFEVDPDDVIVPSDPTQEVRAIFGGDANTELGLNFSLSVIWGDGVVSVLNLLDTPPDNMPPGGLQAGDTLIWEVGPNGETTSLIRQPNTDPNPSDSERMITVTIIRTYPLDFLAGFGGQQLPATLTVINDSVNFEKRALGSSEPGKQSLDQPGQFPGQPGNTLIFDQNIFLTDNTGMDLNVSTPSSVETRVVSEDGGRPPLVPPEIPRPVFTEPRVAVRTEIIPTLPSQFNRLQDIDVTSEETQVEGPVLYLVAILPDGTEGPRIKLPVSDLRDLTGLLERLRKAQIPSGLYRLYYQEPGLPEQLVLEFRKTGSAIGDTAREPGRGTNPVDGPAEQPREAVPQQQNAPPARPVPPPQQGMGALPAGAPRVGQPPIEQMFAQAAHSSFSRAARLVRSWLH
jgi:hypothetical protein